MFIAQTTEPDKHDDNEEYTGACMEVAGIESCGLGFSAPRVSTQNQEDSK